MTPSQFLFQAFKPDPIEESPQGCNLRCTLSGILITSGYPLKSIVSDATDDIADTFKIRSVRLDE